MNKEDLFEEEKEIKEEPIIICPICNETKGISKFTESGKGCRDCRRKDASNKECCTRKSFQMISEFADKSKTCDTCIRKRIHPGEGNTLSRLIVNIKEKGKCQGCGYHENPQLLDFAHFARCDKMIDPKTDKLLKNIHGLEMENFNREIIKTRLLCKMCHHLETIDENTFIFKEPDNKKIIQTERLREEKGKHYNCVDCFLTVNKKNVDAFFFDYVDKKENQRTIAQLYGGKPKWSKLEAALDNAVLRCANCYYTRVRKNMPKTRDRGPGKQNKEPKLWTMPAETKPVKEPKSAKDPKPVKEEPKPIKEPKPNPRFTKPTKPVVTTKPYKTKRDYYFESSEYLEKKRAQLGLRKYTFSEPQKWFLDANGRKYTFSDPVPDPAAIGLRKYTFSAPE